MKFRKRIKRLLSRCGHQLKNDFPNISDNNEVPVIKLMDYTKTITEPQSSVIVDFSLAGVAGIEPATNGFGVGPRSLCIV
jgi:hypothetical protein